MTNLGVSQNGGSPVTGGANLGYSPGNPGHPWATPTPICSGRSARGKQESRSLMCHILGKPNARNLQLWKVQNLPPIYSSCLIGNMDTIGYPVGYPQELPSNHLKVEPKSLMCAFGFVGWNAM